MALWWMFLLITWLGGAWIAPQVKHQQMALKSDWLADAAQLLREYGLAHPGLKSSDGNLWLGEWGFLPCPDVSPNLAEGMQEGHCGGKNQAGVGHFPWRYFQQTPWRSESGQCLWYVVSGQLKKVGWHMLPEQINADKPSRLIYEGRPVAYLLIEPQQQEVCEQWYQAEDFLTLSEHADGQHVMLTQPVKSLRVVDPEAHWKDVQGTQGYRHLQALWWQAIGDCVASQIQQASEDTDASVLNVWGAHWLWRDEPLREALLACDSQEFMPTLAFSRMTKDWFERLAWQRNGQGGGRLIFAGEALSGQVRWQATGWSRHLVDWFEQEGNDWQVCLDPQGVRQGCEKSSFPEGF